MFGALRRLLARGETAADAFEAVADWARRRNLAFRRARAGTGFVVEGTLESRSWRLEWGPSQRSYIDGRELRCRMALDLPADEQMLLLSRPLMDVLERRTYEAFIDDVQTQAGADTPEEMRWLVMFPKVDLSALGALGLRFGAVASQASIGRAWIAGPLADQLLHEAGTGLLQGDPPFVLMTLRGRAYLRLALATPAPAAIDAALALFETAVTQAMRVAGDVTDTSLAWTASATSAWQSLQPGDSGKPGPRR